MLYIHDEDWRNVAKDASSIIIPMAGRYDWFKDRNRSIAAKWEMVPNNAQWLMNTYMGKFKAEECVESLGYFSSLSGTYGQVKNVSTTLVASHIPNMVKPTPEFLPKVSFKPTIISLTVATAALNFDNKTNTNLNELICEPTDEPIVGGITRALTKAIDERNVRDNNNIFITPLFRNNIYLPADNSKANKNWIMPNYVNSLVLSLARYDLDKFNIHIFVRTQPRVSNVN